MTTDRREFVEFAAQARSHLLKRSGSFGDREEPDAVLEHPRSLWT